MMFDAHFHPSGTFLLLAYQKVYPVSNANYVGN